MGMQGFDSYRKLNILPNNLIAKFLVKLQETISSFIRAIPNTLTVESTVPSLA